MSDLLPPNRTPLEAALDRTTSRLGDVPVPIKDLWSPNRCPVALLPWLAWALSVDEWDSDWPEARKREAIAASIEFHRYKGTVWSVREALRRIGYKEVEIEEGVAALKYDGSALYDGTRTYSGQGEWYSFNLRLDLGETAGVTAGESRLLRKVAERASPLSRNLNDVRRTASIEEKVDYGEAVSFGIVLGTQDGLPSWPRYDGSALYDGSITYGGPKADRLEIEFSTGGSESL